MPLESDMCEALAKLLPDGYSVVSGSNNNLSILSATTVVVAQIQLSEWAIESEENLRTYLANLSATLLRHLPA